MRAGGKPRLGRDVLPPIQHASASAVREPRRSDPTVVPGGSEWAVMADTINEIDRAGDFAPSVGPTSPGAPPRMETQVWLRCTGLQAACQCSVRSLTLCDAPNQILCADADRAAHQCRCEAPTGWFTRPSPPVASPSHLLRCWGSTRCRFTWQASQWCSWHAYYVTGRGSQRQWRRLPTGWCGAPTAPGAV